MWIRVPEELGDDPHVQLAAFTYASDMSLLGATLAAHDSRPPDIMMASLDHTIWFHRPFRADDWWLYDQHSPVGAGWSRPGVRRGLHPGRPAGRVGGPGGADPARVADPRV